MPLTPVRRLSALSLRMDRSSSTSGQCLPWRRTTDEIRTPIGEPMFDHVKFGVSDYAASKAFYLKALGPLGVAVVWEGPPPGYGAELVAKNNPASLCFYETTEKPAH